ncbi:MAG: hypothetical protein IT350_17730 [Deltaproteobacteria bacterium]|nr:hypothetical protein [Deltaproteobacteria bacterium]
MAGFAHRVVLGRSGLSVSPLGVAGGYGVPTNALLEAFERGVNYWYHGSRRAGGMTRAIREIVKSGRRDQLAVVLQSYSRWPSITEKTFAAGLKAIGLDYADVLLLGWFNGMPSRKVLDGARALRDRGLCRHVAISSHHRPAFVDFEKDDVFSVFHIRYNAAHTGAEKDIFPRIPAETRPGTVAYTATRWRDLLNPSKMPPGEVPLRGRDCYRFVLSNADFNVCMTGPSNAEQMREALAALDEGPLTPEENERFRRIGRHIRGKDTLGNVKD